MKGCNKTFTNLNILPRYEDEDDIPHRHNFSALDRVSVPVSTEADLHKKEVMKKILQYPFLFDRTYKLLYEAHLRDEDLDETYEDLKRTFYYI